MFNLARVFTIFRSFLWIFDRTPLDAIWCVLFRFASCLMVYVKENVCFHTSSNESADFPVCIIEGRGGTISVILWNLWLRKQQNKQRAYQILRLFIVTLFSIQIFKTKQVNIKFDQKVTWICKYRWMYKFDCTILFVSVDVFVSHVGRHL